MKPRRLILSAVASLILATIAVVGAGTALSYPASRSVGKAPAALNAASVHIHVSSNQGLSGWFVHAERDHGAVLLLHGVRADRRTMLSRAALLKDAGYSVLLVDLPAHGESDGERITFGLREATGVRAALAYLRQAAPGDRIGVIGVSLGAASLVLSNPQPTPDAVVLESMYPTITEALVDRLTRWLGPVGAGLAPLLLWQLPLHLDISPEQLRPIDELPSLKAPVLIASGTEDRHTTLAETRRIFEAAAQPKELWEVEGAAHVDLYNFAPKAYEGKVLPFLAKHLRDGV